jgi:uncharacterized membrane protein YfcA
MEAFFRFPVEISITLSIVVVFTAFYLRGFTGFGSAVFGVPLILLMAGIGFVVPAYLILDAAATGILTIETKKYFRWRIALPVVLGMIPGNIVGTYILSSYEIPALKIILGILILIFSLYTFFVRKTPEIKDRRGFLGFTAGCVSGVLGGIFGVSGPPIVIYLKYRIPEKDMFRAQIVLLIIFENVFRVFLYTYGGLFNPFNLTFALILLPAMAVGLFLGSKSNIRASQRTFDIIAAGILTMAGAGLIFGF